MEQIAAAFKGAGFPVALCSNMDAWLKTHVAEISPTANALYLAGGDNYRLYSELGNGTNECGESKKIR